MSDREPGQHPYARAYEKATGKRTERAFVPPFRAPSQADDADEADGASATPPEDPDTPRIVNADRPHGYGISRAALVLVALALGLGLLIGRVSVNTDPASVAQPTPSPTKSTAVPLGPTSLRETGALCSQQRGNELVLGVEVHNVSTSPVILQRLEVTLPPKGLTLAATGTGACGEIRPPALREFGLATEGTVWLSATLRVTVACPSALPVSMQVYATDTAGRVQAVKVPGFANLRDVPWSGCTRANSTTSGGAGPSRPASRPSTSKTSPKR